MWAIRKLPETGRVGPSEVVLPGSLGLQPSPQEDREDGGPELRVRWSAVGSASVSAALAPS